MVSRSIRIVTRILCMFRHKPYLVMIRVADVPMGMSRLLSSYGNSFLERSRLGVHKTASAWTALSKNSCTNLMRFVLQVALFMN